MIEEVRVVLRRAVCDVKGCGFIGNFHNSRQTLREEMSADMWKVIEGHCVCPDCVVDQSEGKVLEYYADDFSSSSDRSYYMYRQMIMGSSKQDIDECKIEV